MSKRLAVVSDTQLPFHDRKALKAVINFIGATQPDEVVHIGDLVDYPQPSRWNKDKRGEFEGSVYEDSEKTKRDFLKPLRDVYQGPVGVLEGNHDLRPREYLEKYAPALAGTRAFDFDVLLDFEGFGVSVLPEFYEFATNWIMTHGHRGGIGLSRIAGNTALNAAKKMGVSLIMGHTHRLGMGSHTTGYGGNIRHQLTGVEVGNLMDMRQAQYLKGATANWQQGFVVVDVDGRHVRPQLVPIQGKKFTVDGRVFHL